MKKLLCVVLVSSLFLVTLAAGASSPPPTSSLSRQKHFQVLGRKGRELGQLGYSHQHGGKYMQNSEEVVTEVRKPAEKKAGWTDQGEGGEEKGPIYDAADYEGVAMHAGSPPKRKHPKP